MDKKSFIIGGGMNFDMDEFKSDHSGEDEQVEKKTTIVHKKLSIMPS